MIPAILNTNTDTAINPVPLQTSGFPSEIKIKIGDTEKTFPVAYLEKDALSVGRYTHPVTGAIIDVPASRVQMWVDKFNLMRKAGIDIAVPVDHSEKAEDNRGFVVKMSLSDNKLKYVSQVIGEDGARLALTNRCSPKIVPDFVDSTGKHWGEAIQHIALTPIPVMHGEGSFKPFLASKGETPVFYLGNDMDITKLRTALGSDSKISDEDVITAAITKITEKSDTLLSKQTLQGELTTATTKVTVLETELAAANTKVIQLSKSPDMSILEERAGNMIGRLELCNKRGLCTKPQNDLILAAIKTADNKPNVIMLSKTNMTTPCPVELALGIIELNEPFTASRTNVQQLNDPGKDGISPERRKALLSMANVPETV